MLCRLVVWRSLSSWSRRDAAMHQVMTSSKTETCHEQPTQCHKNVKTPHKRSVDLNLVICIGLNRCNVCALKVVVACLSVFIVATLRGQFCSRLGVSVVPRSAQWMHCTVFVVSPKSVDVQSHFAAPFQLLDHGVRLAVLLAICANLFSTKHKMHTGSHVSFTQRKLKYNCFWCLVGFGFWSEAQTGQRICHTQLVSTMHCVGVA